MTCLAEPPKDSIETIAEILPSLLEATRTYNLLKEKTQRDFPGLDERISNIISTEQCNKNLSSQKILTLKL